MDRIDGIFSMVGKNSRGKKCVGMERLIEEAKEIIEEGAVPGALDAALTPRARGSRRDREVYRATTSEPSAVQRRGAGAAKRASRTKERDARAR